VRVDGWYGPDEAKKEILSGVENYKREVKKA
jgi:inorganic pyrophosphatase